MQREYVGYGSLSGVDRGDRPISSGMLFLKFSPSFGDRAASTPMKKLRVRMQLVVSGEEVPGEEAVELGVLEKD